MTDPTPLSPAAWAVASAASVARDHARSPIAAALRAAADQVEPDDGVPSEVRRVLDKLLAIATELEGLT